VPQPPPLTTVPAAEQQHHALPDVRRLLEQQRRFRLDQLNELAVGADGAAASQREVTEALREAAERVLDDIEAALIRLDLGRYGLCDVCSEPIQPERLEAIPMSRHCAPCQYGFESAGISLLTPWRTGARAVRR
jgi:DnaK suppressor protein